MAIPSEFDNALALCYVPHAWTDSTVTLLDVCSDTFPPNMPSRAFTGFNLRSDSIIISAQFCRFCSMKSIPLAILHF